MLFCFADDAEQKEPTREGMRPLVGVGGIFLSASAVGPVQRRIDELCAAAGFPGQEEFKWSPGGELWMKKSLHAAAREGFFLDVLATVREHGASAVVVAVDTRANAATAADDPGEDATRLFLERASNRFFSAGSDGCVIVDRPSGDRRDENRFLAKCVDHLQDDTTFAVAERFAMPVMATQSRFVRLLQVADLVTSATLAFVAGENQFSPPVFEAIRPMLATELDRAGGVGLKIHPDFRYANLYHWLLGDEYWVKGNVGDPLPKPRMRYAAGPGA